MNVFKEFVDIQSKLLYCLGSNLIPRAHKFRVINMRFESFASRRGVGPKKKTEKNQSTNQTKRNECMKISR